MFALHFTIRELKGELHSQNKLYSYETSYFNQHKPEILQRSNLQLTRNRESKPEKSPSFRRHVVFLEQTQIVSGFQILTSLSPFSLDGIVVWQAITMNIVVERSSDDDYSSLNSCSSLGENLNEFLNIIYKEKTFSVIDFNPYKILTRVNQGSIWRLKWKSKRRCVSCSTG